MRHHEFFRVPPEPRRPGQLRDGLHYVARSSELLVPLVMIAVVGTLAWEFQVSLPLVARSTFHGDAGTYGTMMAVMGAGAVIGGLIAARQAHLHATSLARSSIFWGIAIIAAALAPTLPAEYAILLLVGYGSISFNSIAKTWLQLSASPSMRGRVMALWSVAWLGSTPIGAPIVGWVGQNVGARWSLAIGGFAALAVGLLSYPSLVRIDHRARRTNAEDSAMNVA
jgi:predicted MFS family arabinose efflux permease